MCIFHKYELIRKVDYKEYKECKKCGKRIVISNSCLRNGRNLNGHNALADTEWIEKRRYYPRSRKEILGPRPSNPRMKKIKGDV